MQTKEQIFSNSIDWAPATFFPDLVASAAYKVVLPDPLAVVPSESAEAGEVVLARVREVNPHYPTLETMQGREVILEQGNLFVGVLGARKALRGFSGKPPEHLEVGDTLHLLNKGGVIGECTAFNRDLGWPATVEYLGSVSRNGHPLNLKHQALSVYEGPLPDVPVIMVMGTCMNAGKTTVCRQILRMFSQKGFHVNAGKVAGVACLQDTLKMKKNGAQKVLNFQEFGLASTTGVDSLVPIARSLIYYLAESQPDFIILEMGDGILGGYQVASVFDDADLMSRSLCTILCANDLMGVWGAVQWMEKYGPVPQAQRPALISGPVTDSQEGIRYIEENWNIPAANAFDSAGKICTILAESLMPWLKSE
jgi:hypothetical protein